MFVESLYVDPLEPVETTERCEVNRSQARWGACQCPAESPFSTGRPRGSWRHAPAVSELPSGSLTAGGVLRRPVVLSFHQTVSSIELNATPTDELKAERVPHTPDVKGIYRKLTLGDLRVDIVDTSTNGACVTRGSGTGAHGAIVRMCVL
jgi:hypothetical protein